MSNEKKPSSYVVTKNLKAKLKERARANGRSPSRELFIIACEALGLDPAKEWEGK